MTLWAQQTPDGNIEVHCTYGPTTFQVIEPPNDAAHFWSELGRVVAAAEGKTPGQRAYERYAGHTDGRSLVSGETLPEWAVLGDDIKAAWEHTVR